MSMVAILLGSGFGLGLLLIAAGIRGTRPATGVHRLRTRIPIDRLLGVAAVAAVTFAVTGWPVLAVLAACGAVAVPRVLSAGHRRAAATRSGAVAQWIEMLRDTMAGAAGLEEAIVVSARRPPPAIAPAVLRLAGRLEHQRMSDAMRGFADDIDDPTADLLAAALITAGEHETRDLGRLLAALVEATRAQVAMRASVDAGRAHVRSATRLVLIITAVFCGALLTFSADYLAPYGTVEGQLWLAVVGGVVASSLMLLGRLDRIDLPSVRLLARAPDATGERRA
jgi:tight adherence protein B